MLVSHAPATIERACRRVVVLDSGKVVFDGPTAAGLRFYHELLGLESAAPAADSSGRPSVLYEARLQDGDGRPRQVFASGERLRVALVLEADQADAERELVIEIRQVAGPTVFRTSRVLATASTRQTVTFDVPRLALLGGDYELAAAGRAVRDTEPPIFDRVLPFSVAHAEGAEGIADLRGTWARSERPVPVAGSGEGL